MKKLTLIGIVIILGGLSIFYWPVPVEGFWSSPIHTMGPGIAYYFFKDGKIIHHVEGDKAVAWVATYERIGLNKYQIDCPGPQSTNYIFRTGLLRSRGVILGGESKRIRDDSRYIHVYNNNEVQWLTPIWVQSILVATPNFNEELFFNGGKTDLKALEDRIANDRIKLEISKEPIQIYSSANGVPFSLLTLVTSNNFKYVLHTNNNWVAELDRVYIQVSKKANAQLDYSIKYKWLNQGDLRNVGIERMEQILQKNSQDGYGWHTARPKVITILTHSLFDISQLLAVMERVGQEYKVVVNDLWIEKTDKRSLSLLYFEDSFLGYCHFNGHSGVFSELKYKLASFQTYREMISRPIVVYAPNKEVPLGLAQMLEASHISYTVKSNEILRKKDYVLGNEMQRSRTAQ